VLLGSQFAGLGSVDDSTDTADAGFFTPALGGSLLTVFGVGLGVIAAAKLLSGATTGRSTRVWKDGAWRKPEYEERLDPEWGRKLVRSRKRSRT
jgi:hypothetical protein